MDTKMASAEKNPSEMRKLSIEIQKSTNDKYLEASRGILSPEQVEQYKNYLLKKSEESESMMKMSEYLNE
jgi:ribosomal 30S subunit maturation factor RimM